MHGMLSDVEINSVTQNSFWPKKMRENPVNSAFKMYSNISEAYSYNLWTTFGTTEAQTLMKRAKLSVKAILIFNQTAGAKKKKKSTP